ncbi:hypothetical protein ACHAXT_005727 [Thalassiosira profunda]
MWPPSFLLLACDGTRRAFLGSASCGAASVLVGPPTQPAVAAQDSELYLARPMGVSKDGSDGKSSSPRPSAPLEYLLPAARVGTHIYQSLAYAEQLSRLMGETGEDAKQKRDDAIEKLEHLLLRPPAFVRATDPSVTRGDPYNLPPLVGEVAAQQQKQRERQQRSIDVGLAPQLFEVGELMGERRQWSRLVRAERAREDASEVRRALNIYTTNLNFNPTKYVYSGSREEKSRLIREDKLPTATEVIRSDLDARDLYRNAVQTALDDARAEFVYQKKNGFKDASELEGLLREAQAAIDKWFGFVPDEDVREALEVLQREQAG